MGNILLLRWGGLGDLLVALPAIHVIRKKFPAANLTLVCQKRYGEILEKGNLVDKLVDTDSPELLPLFLGGSGEKSSLTPWLGSFDLIVGWFTRTIRAVESSLNFRPRGACYLFYYEPTSREPVSLHFFQKTVQIFGRGNKEPLSFEEWATLDFGPGWEGKDSRPVGKESQKSERYVVVHPGSGSAEKCWPLPNFLTILEYLRKRKTGGILVTGEAEARMHPILKRTALPDRWFWAHTPSLVELCRLLSKAALYLGNDSGVTHLAAACGTQVLALFRQDREIAWRPFGRSHVLSARALEEIDVEEVWGKICHLLRLP